MDYPSDVPQTLGISIVEPNAAGALMPIGLDSGVDNGAEAIDLGGRSALAAASPDLLAAHRHAHAA